MYKVGIGVLLLALVGCTTVRPGEVAVRRSFGKLAETHRGPGLVMHSPVGVRFVRVPVRTNNLEVSLSLPSQEGLNVGAVVSILYHVEAPKVPELLEGSGVGFEQALVMPVFRSAAADVTAGFLAKDMHSGRRVEIEERILELQDAKRDLAEAALGTEGGFVKSLSATELRSLFEGAL